MDIALTQGVKCYPSLKVLQLCAFVAIVVRRFFQSVLLYCDSVFALFKLKLFEVWAASRSFVVAVAESMDFCFLAHPSLLGLIVVVKGNSVMHHAELASIHLNNWRN